MHGVSPTKFDDPRVLCFDPLRRFRQSCLDATEPTLPGGGSFRDAEISSAMWNHVELPPPYPKGQLQQASIISTMKS